jgi:nucleotide-binding universal stress UspA family protein
VLAAVDFSAASLGALRTVVDLLGGGERVEAVHIAPAPRIGGITLGPTHGRYLARRLGELLASVELPLGTHGLTTILDGEPGRTLLEEASHTGAELITLGSHGHSAWQRLLMGSVSSKVLRLAECAVLVYPTRCPATVVGSGNEHSNATATV